MKTNELVKVAVFGAATGARVSAAPTALAWSASSSDPAWLHSPIARGVTTLFSGGEAVGDQLARTKSRTVREQLIPRLVLAAGGGALLARRWQEPVLLGAAVAAGGSLIGVYGGLQWRTWAARQFGRDNYGAVAEDALVVGAATWAVR